MRPIIYLKSLLVLTPFIVLSACGGGSSGMTIKAVDVSTTQNNGHNYVNMNAIVSIGALAFPNVEVPILNPTNMQVFGQLAMQHLPDGTNEMWVSVDFDAASSLSTSLGTSLPNGREIPLILGATGTSLIGIPILSNSRIYVGGDLRTNLYVGAAVSISAFDSLFRSIALPLNIFVSYPFSNSVTGVGGLFTSPTAGQNGIALFVKKSSTAPAKVLARTAMRAMQALTPSTATAPSAPTEFEQLDHRSLIKLNRMVHQKKTLRLQ